MTEYERVRTEAIKRIKNVLNLPPDIYSLAQCANRIVDYILPLVEIKADDQSLPEVPYNYEDECQQYTSYSKAQQDMVKAGFVKVVKEGQ